MSLISAGSISLDSTFKYNECDVITTSTVYGNTINTTQKEHHRVEKKLF